MKPQHGTSYVRSADERPRPCVPEDAAGHAVVEAALRADADGNIVSDKNAALVNLARVYPSLA